MVARRALGVGWVGSGLPAPEFLGKRNCGRKNFQATLISGNKGGSEEQTKLRNENEGSRDPPFQWPGRTTLLRALHAPYFKPLCLYTAILMPSPRPCCQHHPKSCLNMTSSAKLSMTLHLPWTSEGPFSFILTSGRLYPQLALGCWVGLSVYAAVSSSGMVPSWRMSLGIHSSD